MTAGDGWMGGISERPTDVNGALLGLSLSFLFPRLFPCQVPAL